MMNGDVLSELRKISKVLIMTNGEKLQHELAKFMTTDDRKRIWVAVDGEADSKQIAQRTGVPLKTVQNFLPTLKKAELIETVRGAAPRKRVDYVPAEWILLLKPAEGGEEPATEAGGPGPANEGVAPLDKDWGNPSAGSPDK